MDGEGATLSTDYQSAMDALNTPRQTYEEYTEEKYAPEIRQKLKDLLNSSSLDSFNHLVREFNVLAADKLVTTDTAQEFCRRAAIIVRG